MTFTELIPEVNPNQRKMLLREMLKVVSVEVDDDGSSKAFRSGREYEQFRIKQQLEKYIGGDYDANNLGLHQDIVE